MVLIISKYLKLLVECIFFVYSYFSLKKAIFVIQTIRSYFSALQMIGSFMYACSLNNNLNNLPIFSHFNDITVC